MGNLRTVASLLRAKGPEYTALRIAEHLVFWSPISGPLRSVLPLRVREQLNAYRSLGYWPRITNPRSFNEKVLHRKLYTDDPRFAVLEDKYKARSFVEDRVGEHVLPDLYHVTDDPATIPFESLPEQFVVKPTHGSGAVILVEDKAAADFDEIRTRCRDWLSQTWGQASNEYWYADITPRILVEEYLRDEEHGVPRDFKFLVFHGRVKYVDVHVDRFGERTTRLFTREWRPLEVEWGDTYPLGPAIDPPEKLPEMIDVAETLGAGVDFVRVDLYQPNGERVVFGELTLAPAAGREGFDPVAFDFELGQYWMHGC